MTATYLFIGCRRLATSDFHYDRLKSALLLTELFNRLDKTADWEDRKADVHRWLVATQVTNPSPFRNGDGFLITEQAPDSNRRATLAAVDLMETYGVPQQLDVLQLRAYLRPNALYDFNAYEYIPKTIARDRLIHLSDISPLTVMDYLQTELPLWLSILLVLLLVYATIISPVHGGERARLTPNGTHFDGDSSVSLGFSGFFRF